MHLGNWRGRASEVWETCIREKDMEPYVYKLKILQQNFGQSQNSQSIQHANSNLTMWTQQTQLFKHTLSISINC